MESSTLLTDEINIEQERWRLQQSSMSWCEIENVLNSKYRESSRKRLFRCQCCNSTTFLVLSQDKACCFKHDSKEDCAGSRNYTRYTNNANLYENKKHRVGKSIIKDQLKVNLSRFGAKVLDGYLFKEELKFVPDIVVEWPNGDNWTFDYVTGTKSSTYQRYILNKQDLYEEKKFKGYFLFDHSQVARKPKQNALALSLGEKGSLNFLSRDHLWEGLLQDLVERFGEMALVPDRRLILDYLQVHQLLYVTDDIHGLQFKISQLQVRPLAKLPEIPDRWFMIVGKEKPLSLSELFSYSPETHSLSWEEVGVTSEELNHVVMFVQSRYEAIKLQEEASEKKRKEWELIEQEKLQKASEAKNQQMDQPTKHQYSQDSFSRYAHSSSPAEELKTDQERTKYYRTVLDLMRKSSLLESHPRFMDRIRECEEDMRAFELLGQLPERIHTQIRMMQYALQIL